MKKKLVGICLLMTLGFLARVQALDLLSTAELNLVQGGYSCPCTKAKGGALCNVNITNGCEPTTIPGWGVKCSASRPHGSLCKTFLSGYPQKHDDCGSVENTPSGCHPNANGDACVKYQDGNCYQDFGGAEHMDPVGCSCRVGADPTPKNSGIRVTVSGDPC